MSGNRGFAMNPDFVQINADETPSNLNMDKNAVIVMVRTNKEERTRVRVLNPGCGLPRLPWEIAKLGFECQGNEFSYLMLLTSHFVLNKMRYKEMFTIYPYCDMNTNQWSFEEQLTSCKVPDVSPSELMKHIADLDRQDLLSMVAGDFSEIYSRKEQHATWDVIASCFFVDTAHNVLQYLEIFSKCLVMNGYLINLGPLLYHFEDQNDPSIELTYNEIMELLPLFGFKVIYERKKENALKCGYAQNQHSMMQMFYDSAFWVAQKVKQCHIEEHKKNENSMDQDATLSGHNMVGGNPLQFDAQKESQNQLFLTNNLQFSKQTKEKDGKT